MQKKDYCVVGGFNVIFDFTSEMMFYAKTFVRGNAIRKSIFKQIMSEFPEITGPLKMNVLKFYVKNYKRPLDRFKRLALLDL